MNKDLFHVVTPADHDGYIVIGGKLRKVPAGRLQVISLRPTGATHANGAKYGEVVHERIYGHGFMAGYGNREYCHICGEHRRDHATL